MKRIHIHISVHDIEASTRFYSAMLGAEPEVRKPDYVKWRVDDPCINLAISARPNNSVGIDHLGIQADSNEVLDDLYRKLSDASYAMLDQRGAKCCYAESDKHWATDPDGIPWEMFFTMGEVAVYGQDVAQDLPRSAVRTAT